jgi:cyclin-dependent kinase 12/13
MNINLQVGAGTFGVVFKATDKETGEPLALKKIRMENESQGFPITALREIRILKRLRHENVVDLKEIIMYRGNGE